MQVGQPVVLRDAGNFTRVVGRLNEKDSYRVGRTNIPGKELIGRRYGETVSREGEAWVRCQPTVVEQALDASSESEPEEESRAAQSALQSDTFASKTIFSQEKYLIKKHKKYANEVTLLEPTIMNLSEVVGSPIRWEAIGLLLRYGNATSGAKVLVWDDATGLPTAALLQRGCNVTRLIAGKGTNSQKCVTDLGVSTEHLKECRLVDHTAQDFYDSVVIVNTESIAEAAVEEIVEKTMASVSSCCGTMTVYTRHMESASHLHKMFRRAKEFINVTMTETFFREHQIMDQRTHPLMSEVSLFQGFIVTCMKVKE